MTNNRQYGAARQDAARQNAARQNAALTPESMSAIISRSGVDLDAPYGLTNHLIYQTDQSGRVKIRVYDQETAAITQQELLQRLVSVVNQPQLLGRMGNTLFFQYFEEQDLDSSDNREQLLYGIGEFLATINKIEETGTSASHMDQEVRSWLERFTHMGFFTQKTGDLLFQKYRELRPDILPVRLDYWDAMPHNFGIISGELVLLDEKHLRPSFPGVGMVKPSWILPPEDFKYIIQGYESKTRNDYFHTHLEFLEFYYLLVALYFYSLAGAAGRIVLGRNPRFLEFRRSLVRPVMKGSLIGSLSAEIKFLRHHPTSIVNTFKHFPFPQSYTR